MRLYRPTYKFPPIAILLLFAAVGLGGTLLGGLYFAITHVINILLFFPLGLGVAGGAVLAWAINKSKMQNPLIAVACGVLMGMVIYFSAFGLNYLEFKDKVGKYITQELQTQSKPLDTKTLDIMTDTLLMQETGATGFVGYLLFRVQQGDTIRDLGVRDINLGEFTWLLWLLELVIISGMAAYIGWQTASEPFCEHCNQWYGNKQVAGSVTKSQTDQFIKRLKAGRYAEAGELLERQLPLPSTVVYFQNCRQCQVGETVITLNRVTLDKKGKAEQKQILKGMLTPFQHADFVRSALAHFASPAENPPSAG